MSTIPMSTYVARRFCGTCGHEIRPQASFCGTCGQTMAQRRPAPPPARPAPPPARPAPPPARPAERAESRSWLIPAVAALVLAAIAVPVMFVAHPFGDHGPGTGPTPPPSATASGAPASPASPSPAAPASPLSATPTATTTASEQQAAESLASLLAQSVADRTAVDHAYDDVQSCGPDPSADAQVFQNAAASRQQLISQLADLPSKSALPPQMLQELSGAWQASATADTDYAQWALDEEDGTCVPNHTVNSNFQAASGPSEQAVQDKVAFTGLWNQLADSYGLTRYGQGQL
jgi:hypothetical protein